MASVEAYLARHCLTAPRIFRASTAIMIFREWSLQAVRQDGIHPGNLMGSASPYHEQTYFGQSGLRGHPQNFMNCRLLNLRRTSLVILHSHIRSENQMGEENVLFSH